MVRRNHRGKSTGDVVSVQSESPDIVYVTEANPDVIEVVANNPPDVIEVSTAHAFIPKVTIGSTAPANPQVNDVWIDTSSIGG